MRRPLTTAAVLLALAAPAHAFTLRKFTLHRHQHTILSGVTVCSKHAFRGRLHVHFWPSEHSARIDVTADSDPVRRSAGCSRLILPTSRTVQTQFGDETDMADWGNGLWRARLSVIASDGETHRTGTRSIYVR